MIFKLFLGLLSVFLIFCRVEGNLEIVQDDELMNLIKTEKHVVVLFTRRYSELCDQWENDLSVLREDLVESLNAWVVKAVDSQLTRLYSPSKEPVLVFFRYGIPLLYDDVLNDEVILHTFINNKEPVVKELTDENFEHLTQAATGATTGDWYVMFYTPDCIDCQRMQARWEAVGAHLKTRMNVARINRATTGAATARRFNVFFVPAFILFRQGKMYRYEIQKYDIPSFLSFAQDWYKNVKPEPVPIPKSPFDDFLVLIVDYLKRNPWLWWLGSGFFILGIIGSLLVKSMGGIEPKRKEKSKNKKAVNKEK